jgi:rod shape-determining protein MreC
MPGRDEVAAPRSAHGLLRPPLDTLPKGKGPGPLARLGRSLRRAGSRLAVTGLVGLCVALLVLAKVDVQLIGYLTGRADDLAAPLLRAVNAPFSAARGLADKAGRLLALHAENERLREENRRLMGWQAEATRLAVQNRALRETLRVPGVEAAPLRTAARLLADSASPFVHTRLLDAGRDRGIEAGMPVMTERGMVGRVVQVGQRSARVILLTDFNARVPVLVESSRDRAILEGNNGPEPTLRFLPLNPRLAIGDRVLTSGDGGLLPPGLLVGQVSRVEDGRVHVAPVVDWSRLDWVAVLRYPGLPAPEETPADGGAAALVSAGPALAAPSR